MDSNYLGAKGVEKDVGLTTSVQGDDGEAKTRACVTDANFASLDETPAKKRRTRRRKNKRRHPYNLNERTTEKLNKPEAPHNSNQFLIEDQVNIKELDGIFSQRLPARTRDSSFSMEDSEGEFYSSPDDEEAFLMKEFDDQYETIHTERLNTMTNNELIQECIQLEKKVDYLTKRLRGKNSYEDEDGTSDSREEMEKLAIENEALRRENTDLRNRLNAVRTNSTASGSGSSSDSCSSCSSSSSDSGDEGEQPSLPNNEDVNKVGSNSVDYTQTNGHSPTIQPV